MHLARKDDFLPEEDEDAEFRNRMDDEESEKESDVRGGWEDRVEGEGVTEGGVGAVGGADAASMPAGFDAFVQAMISMIQRVDPKRSREKERDKYAISPTEAVKEIPFFREVGDLFKYIRSLEAELSELSMPKKYWIGILLSKLPPKVKDVVVEAIEAWASYSDIKVSLLSRVGRTLRVPTLRVRVRVLSSGRDRVERFKEAIRMVERVSMLCHSRNDFKLFLAKGMFCSELTQAECGMVGSQGVQTMDDLIEAASLLKENSLVKGREEPRIDGLPKCFVCHRAGHKSFECPDRRSQKSGGPAQNLDNLSLRKPTGLLWDRLRMH